MESPDSSEMMWKTDTEELSDSKHVNNFTNTVTVKDEQSDSSSDTSLSSPSDSTVTSICGAKKEKLCLVCGDKALGYNFNAVSCESCKAFFRRNAHKTIRGRCEGKCDVNVESRSFCKRCRLAKCFTIGMRKDMILNDEQKQMRKQKIIINKLRRQGHMPPQDTYSASVVDIISSSVSTSPASSVTDDSSQTSVRAKRKPSPIQNQSDMSSGNSTDFIPWIHSQDIVRAVLQKLEVKHRQLIEETEFAMTDSSFLTMTSTSLRTLPANPTEFINVAEVFVRKVIKVAKNVAVFKTMHKDDQIALLKGSVVDIMMIRSAVNYDPYTETWSLSTVDCLKRRCSADSDGVDSSNTNTNTTTTIPTITSSNTISSQSSMISAELLKSGNPETRILFMTYSKFIKALMKGIHGDLIILKLLIMMSLFSADRITLLEPEKVQHAQEQYATALQAYAALRFPEDRTLFARLVMKLTDLRNINEVHSKMLLKMKMDDIEPLLLEIFDLPA